MTGKRREAVIPGMFDQGVVDARHWPSPTGLVAGEAKRDEGTKAAWSGADEVFRTACWTALETVCRRQAQVTSDDIWTHLDGRVVADKVPAAANIIGAIMRIAATRGWLRATNESRKTARPAGHARRIQVWDSLIRRV